MQPLLLYSVQIAEQPAPVTISRTLAASPSTAIGEHIAVCPCVVTLRKSDVRVAGRLAVIYILNLFWIKRDRLRVENESIIIRPIYFIEQLDRCHHVSDSRLVNII